MDKIKKKIKEFPCILPIWNKLGEWRLKRSDTESIFTSIYLKNGWGDDESVSGTGSNLTETKLLRNELGKLIKELHVTSMLDIPCGDFHWMSLVNRNGAKYIGADIVGPLIKKNSEKYSTNNVEFRKLDIIRDDLPTVDLIICRDCLVHFSFSDISSALNNITKSKSTYLLTTTFLDHPVNTDIVTGRWRTLNLNIKPFNLPLPTIIIKEGREAVDTRYRNKALALWKIDDIKSKISAQSEHPL